MDREREIFAHLSKLRETSTTPVLTLVCIGGGFVGEKTHGMLSCFVQIVSNIIGEKARVFLRSLLTSSR